jgi:hypothetical protein
MATNQRFSPILRRRVPPNSPNPPNPDQPPGGAPLFWELLKTFTCAGICLLFLAQFLHDGSVATGAGLLAAINELLDTIRKLPKGKL